VLGIECHWKMIFPPPAEVGIPLHTHKKNGAARGKGSTAPAHVRRNRTEGKNP